ncbi:MAG: UDP-N-acetylmuramoyl-L-alanine--D-glutamate ligase, partial [Clostridia bacterium]|nr:UDP-N-acetylmuramoyl-L-alanine--D-glutamate ligase [Clostridia bacterium]
LAAMGAIPVGKDELQKIASVCDALVLSPGIPVDHPLAVAFKRDGRAVIGETELAARYFQGTVVAVTGTNGKTTTVSMIEKILQTGGYQAKACGNIGAPFICEVNSQTELAVAEISSFQLETLQSLKPHVAVLLNVTEDHLNRHYNMENYVFLKRKIFKNCTEAEYAVLNYDDETARETAEQIKARVVYFSMRRKLNGAYCSDGGLYFGAERIMDVSDLPLDGVHNAQNALAAIAVAKIMGVKNEEIKKALTEFKGIRHRMETVAELNGVRYINDSKGTNVDATLKAVSCMKRETVLLLGGKEKGYDYDKLFASLAGSKIVHAVLYGENRLSLTSAALRAGFKEISVCGKFAFAVSLARMLAKSGQDVLLSPASASFDEFSGYEERGDAFVEIVRSFNAAKSDGESDAADTAAKDEKNAENVDAQSKNERRADGDNEE